jgi:hypothetical protein
MAACVMYLIHESGALPSAASSLFVLCAGVARLSRMTARLSSLPAQSPIRALLLILFIPTLPLSGIVSNNIFRSLYCVVVCLYYRA